MSMARQLTDSERMWNHDWGWVDQNIETDIVNHFTLGLNKQAKSFKLF